MVDTYNMAKQLNGDYREAFETVEVYSTTVNITEEAKDEKLMELYDLLLEAEHEGKSVTKIVGKDLEVFCKNFFSESGRPQYLKQFLNRLFGISCLFFVSAFLDVIWAEEKTDLLPFLVGIGAGLVVDAVARYLLQPLALRKKLKPMAYYFTVLGVFLLCVIAVGFIIVALEYELEIGSLVTLIVTGTYVVVYFVVRSILRYRDHGNIFSRDREEKKAIKKFNEEVKKANLIGTYVKTMAKRFERIQRRKSRRGMTYTFEDFANLIRKEKSWTKWTDMVTIIFFIFIVVGPGIDIMLEGTVLDGLIFMAISAVVEYFICRGTLKISRESTDMQVQVIDECEKRGIDILEYQEELENSTKS